MLLKIDTSSASYIFINIPADKAKFLEQIVKLFEENALFIAPSFNDYAIVNPEISAILKGSEALKGYNGIDVKITEKSCVIENFEKSTPELHLAFDKYKKEKEYETERLKKEISILEGRLNAYESKDEGGDE